MLTKSNFFCELLPTQFCIFSIQVDLSFDLRDPHALADKLNVMLDLDEPAPIE